MPASPAVELTSMMILDWLKGIAQSTGAVIARVTITSGATNSMRIGRFMVCPPVRMLVCGGRDGSVHHLHVASAPLRVRARDHPRRRASLRGAGHDHGA